MMMIYHREIDEMRRRGLRPMVVRTFEHLLAIRDEFTIGRNGFKTPFLFVIGSPGSAKTFIFHGPDATYINTAASPAGLYEAIYQNRNPDGDDPPLVLDDIDDLLTQRNSTSLFKAIGTDEEVKRLSWRKLNSTFAANGIPSSFTTTARLCILCNDVPRVSMDIQGVLDRAKTVFFIPTAEEIHNYVSGWFRDREILDFFSHHLAKIAHPSIRLYLDARREKRLGNDWQRQVLEWLYADDPELFIVADIMLDERFADDKGRAAEFHRRTGKCRATWYNYKKQWKKASQTQPESVQKSEKRSTFRPAGRRRNRLSKTPAQPSAKD